MVAYQNDCVQVCSRKTSIRSARMMDRHSDANPVREERSSRWRNEPASGLASWERGVCSMSKWKPTPMRRSLKPSAEGLETRELLDAVGRQPVPKGVPTQAATAVVRGMDPDGSQWTMRLYGPGALNVVGTHGDVFTPRNRALAGIDRHDHRRWGDHDVNPSGRRRFIPTRYARTPRFSSRT